MKYALLLILTMLTGCSVLNDYGIGGPPRLACASGGAAIDDRIVGSDDMHVSFVRRFVDGDPLCAQDVRQSAAAQAERDQAARAKRHSDGRMDH